LKSILFITYEYPTHTPFGGIAFYYFKTAEILSNLGYQITVLTARPKDAELIESKKKKSMLNEIFLPSNNLREFKNELINWFKNFSGDKFDLIEAPEYGAILFDLLKSGNLYNYTKRVSIRVHGTTILAVAYGRESISIKIWIAIIDILSRNRFSLKLSKYFFPNYYNIGYQNHRERELVNCVDSISVPSLMMANFVNRHWLCRRNRVISFPNPSQFNPIAETEALSISEHRIVTYINRAQRLKGYDLFEKLAMNFYDQVSNDQKCKFYCYGKLESNFIANTAAVYQFGHVDPKEIVTAMKNSFLIIIPSRFESFSNVALEAMSLGCLVLISDNMGISEHVTDNINGFIFKSGVYSSLEEKFQEILNLSKKEINNIRNNALLKAHELSSNVDLIEFYEKQLSA